ncbi:hypothetical protein [Muricoccus aerilatus]|uniref:hypothetical protein n=1 Tax=Muricoccus aerilatus TaxID=452982 RepID=UPI0005C14D0C|nr:hypothetical protein [Roseomonas aerilata]
MPGTAEQALSARAAVYATRARGEGTRRAYRSAWSAFEAWCASLGREPLAGDAETLAMYAVRGADRGLTVVSLRVHLATIQAAHRLAGLALTSATCASSSLRAGLVTAAGEAGADLAQVMRQIRHRSADVAPAYLRPADLWRNTLTRGIWGAPEDAD